MWCLSKARVLARAGTRLQRLASNSEARPEPERDSDILVKTGQSNINEITIDHARSVKKTYLTPLKQKSYGSYQQQKQAEEQPNLGHLKPMEIPIYSVTHGALVDVEKQQEDLLKLAMPFETMPGPKILTWIAKAWKVLPAIGTQLTASFVFTTMNMLGSSILWNREVWHLNKLFDHFGPVIRLPCPMGNEIVIVSRPEHVEAVYRQEGQYPVRSCLDSIEEYRLNNRNLRMAGLFIMSGPDWEDLRCKIEAPLQRSVQQYHDSMGEIAQELVDRIKSLRNLQEEVPKTFDSELYKWSLESVGVVAFNKRLGCLQPTMSAMSEANRLLDALRTASRAVGKCESGFQWWRFFETPSWRNLTTSCDTIDSITSKHISMAQKRLKEKKQTAGVKLGEEETVSLMETLLLIQNLLPEDLLTVVLDMLLIGVNATCHAITFLLFHLSKSPRIQRELLDELIAVAPHKNSQITPEHLQQLPLLQACIKESLRLNPPMPVTTRILPKDIALHSYRIPKGTFMLMTSHVASLREENFEDALRFKPERWLSNDSDIHPFAAIPFGHGPRSCIGRGLAEMQLGMLAAKLVRNFRIEYHYGDFKAVSRFISLPNKPLKFRFVDRVE